MSEPACRLPGDADAFLAGKRFASGQRIRVVLDPGAPRVRADYLLRAVAGRRVIHVGCADHLPLIDAKIAAGTWLHARLAAAAAQCIGVDTDVAAIAHLRERHRRHDVHCADLTLAIPPELASNAWDDLVLGEVLEHVDDPVVFLAALRRQLGPRVARVLVTVPHAWDYTNLRHALRGREYINTDHRYWFTPYTLAKVAWQAGFQCQAVALCASVGERGLRSLPRRLLLRAVPLLRECLVMTLIPRANA